MKLSEIMTILVLFHLSHYRTFKDFYLDYVLPHLKSYFPKLLIYTRFVELMKQAVMPLGILLNCCKGKKNGNLLHRFYKIASLPQLAHL